MPFHTSQALSRTEFLLNKLCRGVSYKLLSCMLFLSVYYSQPVTHIPLRELLLHALSCCCTWIEAQSNTKHEGGWEERSEGGGLLASCRLNKAQTKRDGEGGYIQQESLF